MYQKQILNVSLSLPSSLSKTSKKKKKSSDKDEKNNNNLCKVTKLSGGIGIQSHVF